MIISIVQPCFVPWLGYFEQIAVADVFVYFDDVQYTKKDWRNNNQLKSPNGVKPIFVPVSNASRSILINEALISYQSDWDQTILNQLDNWYRKAPFFKEIKALIEPHLSARHEKLVDLNYALNGSILSYLGIQTPIFRSSQVKKNTDNKIDRIVEICRHFEGVDILFDGKKAADFLDATYMQSKGIHVVFQDYVHKPYRQLWGDFVPYMSVIDVLMNCGPEARNHIVTSKLPSKNFEKAIL
jgi:hypothetical protein